ncbi:ankyrin repeat domain-containing protein SOWAHD [Pangasianodon hypophthalmus]|uniref:ankyrin repeat domain-containing protein SOWAHD n=1 Tax=Pangasianodon hypophthalmus TaxID=310915 RepID=UPI000EFF7150|nr:ankyrin repeat domain-containing protein SOWAHD [Pangasianodon hypophthalmus]XP_026774282.1 ankyrin repeat domain-containing protein SOWAHD [Pangasianodon hypophthalmus]
MCDSAGSCELSQSDAIESETPPDSQMGESEALLHGQKHAAKIQMNNSNESGSGFSAEPNPEERAAKVGARAVSLTLSAAARRSRFQRQLEASEPRTSAEVQEKGSITPAMRKKFLKDLFLNYNSHSGLSTILSFKSASESSKDCVDGTSQGADESNACWVLDPTEHAWMLSAVDGNYDTIAEFLLEDANLLTRKDFVSGYTVLHWLAKKGKHETLLKLLKDAERKGYPVNVNIKGSGGLTPLHVAAMHSQYMVIKILVGAFSASVDAMDYNGKRAWQYLKQSAPAEMKELLGAWDDEHTRWQLNANNNNASCTEVASTGDCQKDTNSKDTVTANGLWRFGSFRKLLSPFFFGGKN